MPMTTTVMMMVIMMMMARSVQGTVRCTAITNDHKTSVTCDFGQDIGKSKHSFNVHFYYPNFSAVPETVLACNRGQSNEVYCQNAEDVHFDKMISDKITLTRAPALDKLGGIYLCQAVPSLSDTTELCRLIDAGRDKGNTTSSKAILICPSVPLIVVCVTCMLSVLGLYERPECVRELSTKHSTRTQQTSVEHPREMDPENTTFPPGTSPVSDGSKATTPTDSPHHAAGIQDSSTPML